MMHSPLKVHSPIVNAATTPARLHLLVKIVGDALRRDGGQGLADVLFLIVNGVVELELSL